MNSKQCTKCGSSLKDDAKFCAVCGARIDLIEQHQDQSDLPSASKTVRTPISGKAKKVYSLIALGFFVLFSYVFTRHLPGNANPVIDKQPEIAMASAFTGVELTPQPIDVQIENGKVVFPLTLLLEKKMVAFEYKTGTTSLPLLAFISPEGKLVTAVRICEPCNSHTFRIEGTELACGNCESRWKLSNLEGIQGSCQKYPPDPIPSEVVGNQIQIDENTLKNWKMRI